MQADCISVGERVSTPCGNGVVIGHAKETAHLDVEPRCTHYIIDFDGESAAKNGILPVELVISSETEEF